MPINTKRLTKHYPKLSARDRFRLLMAARDRGDEAEARRLVAASPTKEFRIPHYRGYSEALVEVMGCHVVFQLEIGVQMWKSLALMDGATEKERLLAKTSLRLLAALFLLRQQAWQMLCEDYGRDGEGVLSGHPAWATLEGLEATATEYAFSREDAMTILGGCAEADLVSAEDFYDDMKAAVEERAAWWM